MHACRRVICAAVLSAAVLVGSTTGSVRATDSWQSQKEFFATVKSLCGTTYDGLTEFPLNEPGHPLGGGKILTIHFASCSDTEVRIPLHAGEDKSRTWVLTLRDGKLLLKHDHRHADGTPDAQTNYGGWATGDGSAHRQRFAADEETAKLIPDAATNVWTMELDAAEQRLTYSLERHGAPRYKAVFKLRGVAE
jgi:hypothetical protein